MLKWLHDRNASQRVGVIESVQLDGKRSIKLVRRDNIEHLVLVGGRNDLVIEPNIVRRPAPKPANRPVPEMSALPPPGVPTREPLAGSPPKSRQHGAARLEIFSM
jgi:flagellar protein FliO/FliZ